MSNSSTLVGEQRSTFGKIVDKARAKVSGGEKLASSETDFEKEKAKAIEKQKRKEEYEKLGLEMRTKYGLPRAGGWNAM